MNTTICLRIRKELDPATEKIIIRLKGSLIARNFTDIIYFDDDDDEQEYYIHHFTVETARKKEAADYIAGCIQEGNLSDIVMLVEN
ncbi:hypothetical protein GCM10007424_00340 [Flavobacterium suaedae]|uniref:Uncharacterized protein n=1 Tax=Flavobacterium suaedae TaxID=1767027 RepID=A0ABQ1JDC8_9FLAO|nr:hypothetical protein [Flavobacterium suaedae]GGB64388.1 hypothetical protein GCM10007424_00340 [Flavobacterium suaedae]